MRILFAGSPAIAVPSLRALAAEHDIVGVLTNPDSPRGRGKRLEPTDVGAAAEALLEDRRARGAGLFPILKPERLGPQAREAVADLRPELLVAVAYGRIFGPKFLALFPRGGINLHPSLLPRYRGSAPIPAAILNRDDETGICVQRLALEMDAGDLLAVERVPLDHTETTESLTAYAAERGAALVDEVVREIAAGTETAVPQNHAQATYCGMLRKEDGLIDWGRSALELDALIRAYFPWPGTYTTQGRQILHIIEARPYPERPDASPAVSPASDGEPAPGTVVGVDKTAGILVQTGEGRLALRRLQYETKKAMDWRSFLNGARDFIGAALGADPVKAEAHAAVQ